MFDVVQDLDRTAVMALNALARQSPEVDHAIAWLTFHDLLRGGVAMALLWAAWLRRGLSFELRDSRILETLLAGGVAVALGRVLQLLLPYRPRPLHDPAIGFVPPYGVEPETLSGWNSFPSDHAVLFFALATATFVMHRRLGHLAFAWAVFVISIPRIYIGAHYPSDVVAGLAVAVPVVLACFSRPISGLLDGLRRHAETHPRALMAALFLGSFEVAQLFENLRSLAWSFLGTSL